MSTDKAAYDNWVFDLAITIEGASICTKRGETVAESLRNILGDEAFDGSGNVNLTDLQENIFTPANATVNIDNIEFESVENLPYDEEYLVVFDKDVCTFDIMEYIPDADLNSHLVYYVSRHGHPLSPSPSDLASAAKYVYLINKEQRTMVEKIMEKLNDDTAVAAMRETLEDLALKKFKVENGNLVEEK